MGICYFLVCRYLSNRPVMMSDARQKIIEAKRKRNNYMLILVAVTHFLSWLPLNMVNLIMSLFETDENQTPLFPNMESMLVTYAICHLASMLSVVVNPILYGFMNENFRQEFAKIFGKCVSFTGLRQFFTNHPNSNNHNIPQPTQMAERQTKTENRHDEDMV